MYEVTWSTKFRKDYKRMIRRGKNMDKLDKIMEQLEAGQPLAPVLKDHGLVGDMGEWRELHVEPDWLLIYGLENNSLLFVRTGSHADLFG